MVCGQYTAETLCKPLCSGSAPGNGSNMKSEKAEKQGLTLCIKCSGEIFRSEMRGFGELLMAPFVLPFRCSRCGWRQFRSSFSRVRDKNNYRRQANDRE